MYSINPQEKKPCIYLPVNLFIMGLLMVILFTAQLNVNASDSNEKTNIIYILADDLGIGDVGCYGQELIKTPNIDKMADEGMMFTQHYSGSTVCAPSRCALMTGFHMKNADIKENPDPPLPLSTITVAEKLKDAGYATAMMGKWGLGEENTTGEPSKQGFDYYNGYLNQILAHNSFPEYLLENGQKIYLDNEVKYLSKDAWHKGLGSYSTEKNEYSNNIFTKEALRFIEDNQDNPFFLYLPYTIPHDNGEAPKDEKIEAPDMGIYKNKNWKADQKRYAAIITLLDKYVGEILDKIKSLHLDENTLVIFTSDNGPEMGYYFCKSFDSNGKFRGGKRDLYEGGIRMPFIARWPGKIEPGSVSNHISAFWDFLPTACEIAHVPIPEGIDGISFLPALLQKEQPKHEYLYWEFSGRGGKKALRMNQWKAVINDINNNPNPELELYDLNKDPGETNNVAKQNPGISKKMEAFINNP